MIKANLSQISVWTENIESVCGAFETKFNADQALFIGEVRAYQLGNTEVAFIRSNANQIVRQKGKLDRAEDRFCFLIFQPKGKMLIYQDEQKIQINENDIVLLNTAKTIEMFPQGMFEHISVHLSREKLLTNDITAQHFGKLNTSNMSGHLLKNILQQIAHDQIELWHSQQDGNAFEDALIALLKPMIHYGSTLKIDPIKYRAERFIMDQLQNRYLDAKLISNHLGISSRQLYRLFSGENQSISRYIQYLRLQQIYTEISNLDNQNISLTEIALKWGFEDSSHFSRCFKKQYGIAPRQLRIQLLN